MKKFIKWHKEFANKFMKMTGMDSYQLAWFSWFKGLAMGIILMMLLSGCAGTYYVTSERSHPVEVYYNGVDVYFGYHSGFYYYYGIPHYYPWWNYYQACPPHHYHVNTHATITRPVNRPTHRPNRPNKPKVNTYVNKNNTKSNVIRNNNKNRSTNTKVNVNKNRSNKTNINRRKPR